MYTQSRTDMAPTLVERYREVRERAAAAAARSGRTADDILLVAVSKYADLEQIRELIRLGHRDFGESRAQQLAQRAAVVDEQAHRERTLPSVAARATDARSPQPPRALDSDVRWHMIGHLQRNKVKKLIGVARLIHSVDSLRLVEEIQAIAYKRDEPVEVLVQVNCSGEASKHGCAPPAAPHLCEQIDTMIHLKVRGLMTMAPQAENPADVRATFERCRELFEEIRLRGVAGPSFNILSMGMTNDFETAITCGANLVRVGSAIFGEHAPGSDDEDGDDED